MTDGSLGVNGMTKTLDTFDSRLNKIDRNRARLARGYSAKVTDDGLIVFRPKRQRSRVSLRGVFFLCFGFLLFKSTILAHLGAGIYEQRIDTLRAGSIVERAGAVVMQVDPVTNLMAQKLRPFVK